MFLDNNSFKLLDVKLTDDAQTINEAAEKRSFNDEDNESAYDSARIELTSPNRRLIAEVSYVDFTGIDECDDNLQAVLIMENEDRTLHFNPRENYIIELEKIVCCLNKIDTDIDINNLKCSILKLDRLYRQVFALGNMRKDIEQLNRFRSLIQMAKINDEDYQNSLRESLNAYLAKVINMLFSKLEFKDTVELVNEIIAETVGKSLGKKRPKFGYVVEKIAESYMLYSQEKVEEIYDKLSRMIEKAYDYDSWQQLRPLLSRIKQINKLVQPTKIYFLYLGQSEKQFEINNVVIELRLLALYYHTEKELTDLSVKLIEYEIESFPELPLIYEKLINDKNTLTKIAKKNYVKLSMGKLYRDIDKKIIRDGDHVVDNMLYIKKNIGRWKRDIEKISEEAKNKDDYKILADRILSIAKAITWGDCWNVSYQLLQLGNKWAKNAEDAELLLEYNEKAIEWKDF